MKHPGSEGMSRTRSRRRWHFAFAAGAIAVLTAAAYASASSAGKTGLPNLPIAKYTGSGTVGFSIYNGTVPRWNLHDIPDLKQCLARYAPNVDLISQDPKGNAQVQTTQVQAMLAKGIKVLLITPAALTPAAIVTQAKKAGVPVIIYLNPPVGLEKGDITALVGDGPTPIGTAQAQWILQQHYPKGTEIGIINGDLATNYAVLMRTAQLKVLGPALKSGALKVVYDKGAVNWDGTNAEKLADAMLVAHPNVKAVIAGADFLASGVINALKRVGKAGKVDIIGLDEDPIGAQNILLGYQKATVIKSFDAEMAVACQAVIPALAGKPVPTSVFNQTWSFKTAPIPFRDVPVKVVERGQLLQGIAWGALTKAEMCKGLPAGAGKPYC